MFIIIYNNYVYNKICFSNYNTMYLYIIYIDCTYLTVYSTFKWFFLFYKSNK